jgi:fatty-acyl-CoA synthase
LRALEQTASIVRQPQRTFPHVIEQLAERFGEAPALLDDQSVWSFRDLADRAQRYARWALSHGIVRGEVVGLLLSNCPDYLALWLGVTRVGGVVALLNTSLRGSALAHAVHVVGASHLLAAQADLARCEQILPQLERRPRLWIHEALKSQLSGSSGVDGPPDLPAARPSLDDRALFIYTSGTSGLPKAVNISHFRIMQWTHWFAGLIGASAADRMYNCLPMYHSIGGVVAVGAPLVNGGSVVLRAKFSAGEFWSDVVRSRCTLFQYIGELCRYLLQSPVQSAESQHPLRLCCGNGLNAEVWTRFQHRFRIPHILEYYASTEGALSLFNTEERVGAIGRVPALLRHRQRVALIECDPDSGEPVRDEAGFCRRCAAGTAGEAITEIRADAASRFEGYTDPGASARKLLRGVFTTGDLWYRSGDLMRQDASGFFYFVDRLGDTYRWKGENVSAAEVAACLREFPGVLDAVAFGVRIPGTEGRAGMAALQLQAQPLDPTALSRHVAAQLPTYARPLIVRVLDEIPNTGTHKPRKTELQNEGFDPTRVRDPLYWLDADRGSYVALDAPLFERIQAGALRL